MNSPRRISNLLRALVVLGMVAAAATPAPASSFVPYEHFPLPAPGSFTVVGDALPDGRLVLWNGDGIFVQAFQNADRFRRIASGYQGDPSFLSLGPDGRTLLLGPGGFGDVPYVGQMYTMDVQSPRDFTPAQVAVTGQDHYDGAFLTDTLVLLDVGRPDFSGSYLAVIDLMAKSAGPRAVVVGMPAPAGDKLVVDKPPFTYSGRITVDRANGIVYATSAFGTPQEVRYFAVDDLVAAYVGGVPLDWAADGVLIGSPGQFFSGGVSGVSPDGELVIPGSGGIQVVNPNLANPSAATVLRTLDPAGTGAFYSVIYNPVTGAITALDGIFAYGPAGAVRPVPLSTTGGLLVLAGALLAGGLRVRRSARRDRPDTR